MNVSFSVRISLPEICKVFKIKTPFQSVSIAVDLIKLYYKSSIFYCLIITVIQSRKRKRQFQIKPLGEIEDRLEKHPHKMKKTTLILFDFQRLRRMLNHNESFITLKSTQVPI